MNAVLRRVSRQLKYRALPVLIGRRVVVSITVSATSEVHDQLRDSLPVGIQFKGPESKYIKASLAKYGILDLTFTVERVVWESRDGPGMPLLEDFGFVFRDQEPSEALSPFDKDPTCLEQLQQDINEQQTVLKLFFEEQPKRDMQAYIAHLLESGKAKILFNGRGFDDLDQLLVDYFPKTFEVADACLTNADFVWFHKHFYM